jgi:DNA processing protein
MASQAPLDRDEWRAWLGLARVSGVGPVTYRALIEALGSPRDVFRASEPVLNRVPGCSPRVASAVRGFSAWGEVDAELDRLDAVGASVVTWADPRYPVHLRTIHDPPPLLYVLGDLPPGERRVVAVVGSRRATPYGVAVASRIAGELAREGFVVVSGMARGIDTAAHQGALSVGGQTVGVLGCGVDVAYPPESRSLKSVVRAHGAVLSELSPGTPPDAHHFPARNRIISGMSLAVLVIEATAESGSLITARLALEQGREVFAVPGNVGSATSVGTNRLIKAGAALVETAEDVIEALVAQLGESPAARLADPPAPGPELTDDEVQVVELLSWEPAHVDELTTRARMPPERLAGILLSLELKGAARQLAGCLYIREAGLP